jgi:hypothetical protein
MSLELLKPVNSNNPKEERASMEVLADLDLEEYAIVDKTFDTKGQASNIHRHIYRFKSKKVKKGDIVRLISGVGSDTETTGTYKETSRKVHVFYWNSDSCIWNNNGQDKVILIQYKIIDTAAVPAVQ